MQFEPVVVLRVLGYPVYAFGLCLAAAVLAGAYWLRRRAAGRGYAPGTTSVFVLWALVLSLVFSRLLYCLLRWEQIAYDWDGLFRGYAVLLQTQAGGFTLYGAFLGIPLAALIAARHARQPFAALMDWAAPVCALVLALGRGAEILGGGGFGAEVMPDALMFFPVAVYNDWLGAWNYAVFMAEAAAALIILSVLLRLERKPHRTGDLALYFLLYYGASQLVLERFRRDDFLAWGFVLVAQVICVACLVSVALVAVVRSLKTGNGRLAAVLDGLATLMVIVWSGITEFLFDKNLFGTLVIDNATLHLLRAGLLLLIAVLLTLRLLAVAKNSAQAAAADGGAG